MAVDTNTLVLRPATGDASDFSLVQPAEGDLPLTYLAAHVPHLLRVEVGGVCPEATGIDPAQLPCVVLHKICP